MNAIRVMWNAINLSITPLRIIIVTTDSPSQQVPSQCLGACAVAFSFINSISVLVSSLSVSDR